MLYVEVLEQFNESYFELEDLINTDDKKWAIYGNREFFGIISDEWKYLYDLMAEGNCCFGDLQEDISDYFRLTLQKDISSDSLRAILDGYICEHDFGHFTNDQILAMAEAINEEEYSDSLFCKILSAIYGEDYVGVEIHGCCQGDWNNLYIPKCYDTSDQIDEIESRYFNTGTEIRLSHTDDTFCKYRNADEIPDDDYSWAYIPTNYNWSIDKIYEYLKKTEDIGQREKAAFFDETGEFLGLK